MNCSDAFPHIQEVIEQLCQQSGEAKHDAIVEHLMKHPEASGIIERAVGRCPERTGFGIAANMVAWLSQHYTVEQDDAIEFQERFQKRKLDGRWAYSIRQ